MSEKLFTQKYKYTGPTMLLGEYDNIELRTDDHVAAEVNVNVATIKKIYTKFGTTVLNDAEVDVASKYLEPIKPDTINFKDEVDVPHFFDDLFSKIAEINAEHKFPFFDTENIANIKKWAEEHKQGLANNKAKQEAWEKIKNDNIEVGGDHYQQPIQVWDFVYANKIPFDESCIIKYACRHKKKGGAEDVKKIISYAKHILKTQYNEDYESKN